MSDSKIVRRYASALFRAAQAQDVVDLVESDLGLIAYTFETIPNLVDAIVSPVIPASKKREIVTSIFEGKIHEVTLFYLYLVIDHRREEVIQDTEAEYVRQANEARGILLAQVTSAIELTDAQIVRLKENLSRRTGQRVEMNIEIDPSIIGGLVVRIGDTVMDGSIAGHLQRIKDEFLGMG